MTHKEIVDKILQELKEEYENLWKKDSRAYSSEYQEGYTTGKSILIETLESQINSLLECIDENSTGKV